MVEVSITTKNAHQKSAETHARNAKGSYADHWSKAHTQQVRSGQKLPMFTPKTFGKGKAESDDIDLNTNTDSSSYGDLF